MSAPLEMFRGRLGATLARETIDGLCEREIPTHPANYEIWATHKAGTHPDLSRELERLLAERAAFTDAINEDLFERFFANTRLSVQMVEAGDSIARALSEVSGNLQRAGVDTATYSHELSDAAARFHAGISPEIFLGLVANLAEATRGMAQRNARLSEDMAASSRQIDSLQCELRTVKVQALTDSLTGIANRMVFDDTLRRRVVEAQANRSSLCLLLCDIDHFKRVNDTWGHMIGDQVIRFVAQQIDLHAKPDWLAARYGGEEFALIMPRTMLKDALATAESIRESIRAKELKRRSTGDRLGVITASIGLAECRAGERLLDFFGRADACLYASKRSGRDRVTAESSVQEAVA